jgi:hypothetical protein
MNKRILSSFAENSSSFVLLFSIFSAALLWAYLCHHDVLIIADASNSNSGSVYIIIFTKTWANHYTQSAS